MEKRGTVPEDTVTGNISANFVTSGSKDRSSWVGVLQLLIKHQAGEKLKRKIRKKLLKCEGWKTSELLPDNWMYRVTKWGFSKSLWCSDIEYLTKEGVLLKSIKAVKEFMDNSPKYNYIDIDNAICFLREDGSTGKDIGDKIRNSIEVAPPGLKKYKTNRNSIIGSELKDINKELSTRVFNKRSKTKLRIDRNTRIDASKKKLKITVSSLPEKPSSEVYTSVTYMMIPSHVYRSLRFSLNLMRLARRPFTVIKFRKDVSVKNDLSIVSGYEGRKSLAGIRVVHPGDIPAIQDKIHSYTTHQRSARRSGDKFIG